jgi:hypothetical protein
MHDASYLVVSNKFFTSPCILSMVILQKQTPPSGAGSLGPGTPLMREKGSRLDVSLAKGFVHKTLTHKKL